MSDTTIYETESGSQFGRYRIKGQLGAGGMATVYRAYDPNLDRDVALKLLPTAYLNDPTLYPRFMREAKAIAALQHSAIAPVYDFGEQNGQPYLVMQLMPGGSLADRIKQGAMSLKEIIPILRRIGSALDYAHKEGIVHRDLKPANILFDHHGEAYLSDFGIAKDIRGRLDTLTDSNIAVGTPAYMSPEQAMGEGELDGRSDIYSLGVILFEMLTGERPYKADTPMGVAVKHAHDPVPDILTFNDKLPPACRQLINQAMSKNRDDRFRAASALANALQATTTHVTLVPSPAKTIWLKALAGAVIALICFGLLVVTVVIAANYATTPTAALVPLASPTLADAPLITPLAATPLAAQADSSIPETILAAEAEPSIETPTEPAAINQPGAAVNEAAPSPTLQPTLTATPTATPTPETWIAFDSDRDGWLEIYLLNADTNELRRLTNNTSHDFAPAWSPDGRQLAFVSDRDGRLRLYVMDVSSGIASPLTNHEQMDVAPAWSPDGRWIAFRSGDNNGYGLFLIDAQRREPIQLTENNNFSDEPSWSPDGRRLAFVSGLGGAAEIYTIEVSSRRLTRLTENGAFDFAPTWSPDGRYIAFTSDRAGSLDIYIMDNDGRNPMRLTDNPAEDNQPAWFPDSGRLVFMSDRSGNHELYAIDINGANLQRLTNSAGNSQHPAVWRDNAD